MPKNLMETSQVMKLMWNVEQLEKEPYRVFTRLYVPDIDPHEQNYYLYRLRYEDHTDVLQWIQDIIASANVLEGCRISMTDGIVTVTMIGDRMSLRQNVTDKIFKNAVEELCSDTEILSFDIFHRTFTVFTNFADRIQKRAAEEPQLQVIQLDPFWKNCRDMDDEKRKYNAKHAFQDEDRGFFSSLKASAYWSIVYPTSEKSRAKLQEALREEEDAVRKENDKLLTKYCVEKVTQEFLKKGCGVYIDEVQAKQYDIAAFLLSAGYTEVEMNAEMNAENTAEEERETQNNVSAEETPDTVEAEQIPEDIGDDDDDFDDDFDDEDDIAFHIHSLASDILNAMKGGRRRKEKTFYDDEEEYPDEEYTDETDDAVEPVKEKNPNDGNKYDNVKSNNDKNNDDEYDDEDSDDNDELIDELSILNIGVFSHIKDAFGRAADKVSAFVSKDNWDRDWGEEWDDDENIEDVPDDDSEDIEEAEETERMTKKWSGKDQKSNGESRNSAYRRGTNRTQEKENKRERNADARREEEINVWTNTEMVEEQLKDAVSQIIEEDKEEQNMI